MLVKRYKLGATIQIRYKEEDWENITTNLKRYDDNETILIGYCSCCKFWDDHCMYECIECGKFDTTNYTYIPCS